jgi:YfiH family protein
MTTRQGGHSVAPWNSFNLGAMVGDSADAVAANRRDLAEAIGAQPVWLRQVHGCHVLRVSASDALQGPATADAAWTSEPGVACSVLVADCLPVLLAAPTGVAAAHAGWRGLAAGVLEGTVQALCDGTGTTPDALCAWLGPCIGPRAVPRLHRGQLADDGLRQGVDCDRDPASDPSGACRASGRQPIRCPRSARPIRCP